MAKITEGKRRGRPGRRLVDYRDLSNEIILNLRRLLRLFVVVSDVENESRKEKSVSCHCPEVHVDGEWIPFCEGMEQMDAADPEPVNFRCPDCQRSVVRIGSTSAADEMEEHDEDDPWVRFTFRCSTCCWSDYVIVRASWGLLAQ